MAEPLSIASSVAGLISLALQVTQGLHDYYRAFRGQDDNIARLCTNLESLLTAISAIDEALSRPNDRERKMVKQDELNKVKPTSDGHGLKASIKNAGRRLAYPLRESTLRKLLEDVGEFRQNLSIALNVLHLEDAQHARDELDNVTTILQQVRLSQVSDDIRKWLQAPDVSVNHIDASNKRHPTTGLWFVESDEYKLWLSGGSWLWVTGFAGCGKSVLCSTAINHAVRHLQSNRMHAAVCFFYFTFSDNSKQELLAMLRSLVLQLSSQLNNDHADLAAAKKANPATSESSTTLLYLLKSLVSKFSRVYLLIDAIDESPAENSRDPVSQALMDMKAWSVSSLQVLVTSRDERDIRDVLTGITRTVPMENSGVDKDISTFVHEHLRKDFGLRKWSRYHDRIEEELVQRAQGVFRWIECQFNGLSRCPVSNAALEKHLSSLPRSLDQTYERMLTNINLDFQHQARQILALLCFAERPMFASEILDYLAVQTEDSERPSFDADQRFDDEDDILQICPGFLHVSEDFQNFLPARKIRIAHFSVQEYLMSDRCRSSQQVSSFYLETELVHSEITKALLTYLLSGVLSSLVYNTNSWEPHRVEGDQRWYVELNMTHYLIDYASKHWHRHYLSARSLDSRITQLAFELFTVSAKELKRYLLMAMLEDERRYWREAPQSPVSALYLASLLGLRDVVLLILDRSKSEPDPLMRLMSHSEARGLGLVTETNIERDRYKVKHRTSSSFNALHAAVNTGQHEIAELLLVHGMNVNIVGIAAAGRIKAESYLMVEGSPLFSAFNVRDFVMAKLLLAHGADVEDALPTLPNSRNHYKPPRETVDFLVSLSIDPFEGSCIAGHSLLGQAVTGGNVDIVESIMDSSLDITQHGDQHYGCPLWIVFLYYGSTRSVEGSRKIELLLHRLAMVPGRSICCIEAFAQGVKAQGVEVNDPDFLRELTRRVENDYGAKICAKLLLKVAGDMLKTRDIRRLRILLDRGANPLRLLHSLLEGRWREALSPFNNVGTRHHEDVSHDAMRAVLEHTPTLTPDEQLVISSYLDNHDAVKATLSTNQCTTLDVALAWAIDRSNAATVAEILPRIMSIPFWGLEMACDRGNVEIVTQLLDSTLDWHEDSSSVLHAAVRGGSMTLVEMLLQRDAAPDPVGGRSLQWISASRHPFSKRSWEQDSEEEIIWTEDQYSSKEQLARRNELQVVATYEERSRWLENCESDGNTSMDLQYDSESDWTSEGDDWDLTPVDVPYFLAPGSTLTPLKQACIDGRVDIARLLLAHRALVDGADSHTPLMLAAGECNASMVRLLLEAGADPKGTSQDGKTPLLLALRRAGAGNRELIEILCDAGAEIEGADDSAYCSPLTEAVRSGDRSIVGILLERGAKISQDTLEATHGDRELLQLLHYHKRLREEQGGTGLE